MKRLISKVLVSLAILTLINTSAFAAFTIDFESGFVNGQRIEGEMLNGIATVKTYGSTTKNKGVTIFDSDLSGTVDPDLEVALGNVMIFQSNDSPAMTGNIFNTPNDSAKGGIAWFDFLAPVHLESIDLIDIDHGVTAYIYMFDNNRKYRRYTVPQNWTYDISESSTPSSAVGYSTLDLTNLANQIGERTAEAYVSVNKSGFNPYQVTDLAIVLTGSGAIDNITGTTAVPAPGALFLGAMGTCIATWIRRRRAF